jgi:hypothetical protein
MFDKHAGLKLGLVAALTFGAVLAVRRYLHPQPRPSYPNSSRTLMLLGLSTRG